MEIRIKDIAAQIIQNSKGNETIETTTSLEDSSCGVYSVPSGQSTGSNEATVFPPDKALEVIQGLKTQLTAKTFDPQSFDDELLKIDGTKNKSRLGGNTTLSLSVSFAKAYAQSLKTPLYSFIAQYFSEKKDEKFRPPKLMLNLIEGGKHASDSLDIQEILLIPTSTSTGESINIATKVLAYLKEAFGEHAIWGSEGGVSQVGFHANRKAIEILQSALLSLGIKDFNISIDAAANSFKIGADYFLKDLNLTLTPQRLISWYVDLSQSFPLYSIEDPLSEDEWANWGVLRSELSGKTKLIGDDLTTTSRKRLEKAIKLSAIDGVIIKPNQVGTLSETLETARVAKENGLITIVSHRAEETMDDFIADLAVGIQADFLKSGAPTQKERMAKYQRLIEIEKEGQSIS